VLFFKSETKWNKQIHDKISKRFVNILVSVCIFSSKKAASKPANSCDTKPTQILWLQVHTTSTCKGAMALGAEKIWKLQHAGKRLPSRAEPCVRSPLQAPVRAFQHRVGSRSRSANCYRPIYSDDIFHFLQSPGRVWSSICLLLHVTRHMTQIAISVNSWNQHCTVCHGRYDFQNSEK